MKRRSRRSGQFISARHIRSVDKDYCLKRATQAWKDCHAARHGGAVGYATPARDRRVCAQAMHATYEDCVYGRVGLGRVKRKRRRR